MLDFTHLCTCCNLHMLPLCLIISKPFRLMCLYHLMHHAPWCTASFVAGCSASQRPSTGFCFTSMAWRNTKRTLSRVFVEFRTVISVCLAAEESLRGNRYANITSKKALNPLEDQIFTGNQCFQSVLVGHELQERFFQFYQGKGIPPIEEALWIIALTPEGQDELLEVCPGMLITSLFFHSELRFSLKPDDLWGKMQRLKAHTLLRHMASVPNGSFEMDHYRVMMRTWPITAAAAQSQKLQKALSAVVTEESVTPSYF